MRRSARERRWRPAVEASPTVGADRTGRAPENLLSLDLVASPLLSGHCVLVVVRRGHGTTRGARGGGDPHGAGRVRLLHAAVVPLDGAHDLDECVQCRRFGSSVTTVLFLSGKEEAGRRPVSSPPFSAASLLMASIGVGRRERGRPAVESPWRAGCGRDGAEVMVRAQRRRCRGGTRDAGAAAWRSRYRGGHEGADGVRDATATSWRSRCDTAVHEMQLRRHDSAEVTRGPWRRVGYGCGARGGHDRVHDSALADPSMAARSGKACMRRRRHRGCGSHGYYIPLAPSPARPRRDASATFCRRCPYRPTVKSPWAQLASPDSQVTQPISPAHWQLATRRPPAPPSQHSAGADPLSTGKPRPVLHAIKSMFPSPLGDAFCRCHLAPAPAVFPGRPARRHQTTTLQQAGDRREKARWPASWPSLKCEASKLSLSPTVAYKRSPASSRAEIPFRRPPLELRRGDHLPTRRRRLLSTP
ncbi:hypothetical protein PVAP13_7KG093727 [Panicum virgatum]|uniref:Uncharacterized protein n=1 Tax=Panicum virgatum TaxID=38727 RepID=A0A8T0QBT4_PANVG|nr:hypothetical protein PVAP13_7KG093727 [Panicum virgatum]